ncbi:MAG: hypothetical protein FD165_1791 [Gammaproteobacteria bacterium]|nr:MAG: hypothetical protein FD165_1791 [Gammaproteobacteria bacterium]TND04364.1 MAG: hypothetical protein FD120_1478 [Gammaproteobacteria bacterium]
MNIVTTITLAGLLAALFFQQAQALEVDREVMPRITVAGRVISTLDNVDLDSKPARADEIDIDDSSLLLRFDKRLYTSGVAGAVLGFEDNEHTVEFHRVYAFLWDEGYEISIGRMDLRNSLITFPTIRDEDLLAVTHVGNASSNAEFDQLHAPMFTAKWFPGGGIQSASVWAGTRGNSAGLAAPDGFDSVGLGFVHEQAEHRRLVMRLTKAGVLLDRQKVATTAGDEWMNALIAGVEFNLNMNPASNWSAAFQAIHNAGIDGMTATDINSTVNAMANQARARSTALVASVRHTLRPNLLTRWQASMTVARKEYSDITDAAQWSIAPAVVCRIGQGTDLIAQYIHTGYDGALYGGGEDNVIQLGIAFSLETTFNNNIGERNSILNLEHGYLR